MYLIYIYLSLNLITGIFLFLKDSRKESIHGNELFWLVFFPVFGLGSFNYNREIRLSGVAKFPKQWYILNGIAYLHKIFLILLNIALVIFVGYLIVKGDYLQNNPASAFRMFLDGFLASGVGMALGFIILILVGFAALINLIIYSIVVKIPMNMAQSIERKMLWQSFAPNNFQNTGMGSPAYPQKRNYVLLAIIAVIALLFGYYEIDSKFIEHPERNARRAAMIYQECFLQYVNNITPLNNQFRDKLRMGGMGDKTNAYLEYKSLKTKAKSDFASCYNDNNSAMEYWRNQYKDDPKLLKRFDTAYVKFIRENCSLNEAEMEIKTYKIGLVHIGHDEPSSYSAAKYKLLNKLILERTYDGICPILPISWQNEGTSFVKLTFCKDIYGDTTESGINKYFEYIDSVSKFGFSEVSAEK